MDLDMEKILAIAEENHAVVETHFFCKDVCRWWTGGEEKGRSVGVLSARRLHLRFS